MPARAHAVLAPTLPLLMLTLLLFGAANGVLDVAMKAQGVLIEECYRRPIFSALSGLFSAGAMAGASPAGSRRRSVSRNHSMRSV